ncbi:NAD(P)H-binding protein [Craterilacuibacter sp.]|uniref:NAD(P)H-binding protein n=1 Tax=Craterilacuibacter sp. TaxID=2870909 RepID=UPI003F360DFC
MQSLLILGATGAVGQQLLAQALAHSDVACVVAPTRRALPAHAKLKNPIVDFEALPADAPWWQADAALCALGTTRKQAGSDAAFYRVDHDYVLAAARHAHAAGTPAFVLNSSLGADAGARGLYLRTKGEAERDVMALGFASLAIVRPSLLDAGPRAQLRTGEEFGLWLDRHLGCLVPQKWRAIRVDKVADSMLATALAATPGVRVIESGEMAG